MQRVFPTLSECQACRQCCTFNEADRIDAPLFTEETRERVLAEFAGEEITFEQTGQLWRIKLKSKPNKPDRWICPLYDQETARCRIHHYKPFDCYTWPFYIARRGQQIVIAFLPTCPVSSQQTLEALKRYVSSGLAQHMIKEARRYPYLIAQYREEMVVLQEVSDKEFFS